MCTCARVYATNVEIARRDVKEARDIEFSDRAYNNGRPERIRGDNFLSEGILLYDGARQTEPDPGNWMKSLSM